MKPPHSLTADFVTKPYPVYAQFRREQPVWWSSEIRMLCLFRYAEVRAALESPDLTVEFPFRVSRLVFGETLLDLDGEQHANLRRALTRPLVDPAARKLLTGLVTRHTAALLDEWARMETIDFMADFAERLPVRVICDFVGVSGCRSPWFAERIAYLTRHLDGSSANVEQVSLYRQELESALVAQLRAARHEEPLCLLARLAREIACGTITEEEALRLALLTLAAGMETSIAAFGNSMRCLLLHEECFEPLRRQSLRAGQFVQECLRWEPPQHDTARFARKDMRFADFRLKRGQALKLILASANRDEEVFRNGEEFNPWREPQVNLSFGFGTHGCLGKMFATVQLETAFEMIVSAGTILATGETLPEVRGSTFRRPETFPIRLTKAVHA